MVLNLLNKFLRIRLQSNEVYSFVKQLTSICCSLYNIPLLALYAGERKVRFYGVSLNKELFTENIQAPLPQDFHFLPTTLSGKESISYQEFELSQISFSFSGFEITFLYLSNPAQSSAIETSLKSIQKDVTMLLLPMIQNDEWGDSTKLKESLRIANHYVNSFLFLESIIKLVLSIIQSSTKAEYLTCQYKNTESPDDPPQIVTLGTRKNTKQNTHNYTSSYQNISCQIALCSEFLLPNSPAEMYRLNRVTRLTTKLLSIFLSRQKDYYYQVHYYFAKIYESLLQPIPGRLDQMLDVTTFFANVFSLTKEERYVLRWMIVLEQSGTMAMQLLTNAGSEPWEIDYSYLVKKAIVADLAIPIQSPEVIETDMHLFQCIVNCAKAYPDLLQNHPFKNRTELIEEIKKLEVSENFLPLFLKCIEKNFQKKCCDITHCSKELRNICPIFTNPSSENCYDIDPIRNNVLNLQCTQCIVYKKRNKYS